MRRRCEKRISAEGSAEEAGSPKSFWSLQSREESSEFAKSLGRPVPCEQGAADLWATASSADLRFRFYVLLCLCVWVYAIVGLWGCEFVGVWLVFCGLCVCVLRVCVCLRAVCFV